MRRVERDEQGVALVLALSFMVLVGLVTSALLSSLISSVGQRSALDGVRNRQYAADAAVEQEIARVRALPAPGAGSAPCAPSSPISYLLNGYTIHVDCTNVRTMTFTGFEQRNVVFTSCVQTGSPCTTANTIVRAQVNYEGQGAPTPTVTKTYIQSWTTAR
jgi:hypothetical protein